MEYKILETHLIFENDALKTVAVLWENKGDTRATISTTKPSFGYHSFKNSDTLTIALLVNVVRNGRYLTDNEKKRFFPKLK